MRFSRIVIDNIETKYLIYENGTVYSEISSKFIKPNMSRGYLKCSLRVNGKTYVRYIHRLVAESFLDVIEGYEVNHIDGNKLNNDLSNLEWVSRSENIKHAYDKGLKQASYEQIKRPVYQIDLKSNRIIKEFSTVQEAAIEMGNENKAPNIIRACQGIQKTSYGFRWEYKDGRKDKKWNEL